MNDIALTVSILALVTVAGLFIGDVELRGIRLGIDDVLFGGIVVSHFVSQAGMTLNSDMLYIIQELGLILFVYTTGVQVGPGFFASLRVSGLHLSLSAVLIIIIGDLVIAILHKLFDIPLPIVPGIFSDMATNMSVPGAGQQVLCDPSTPMEIIDRMGMDYAMAHPFDIYGALFTIWMSRIIFRINVKTEAQQYEPLHTNGDVLIKATNIHVENPSLYDLAIKDVPILSSDKIICSRLRRGRALKVPSPDIIIQLGDLLYLVGRPANLYNAQLVISQEVDTSLFTKGTDLRVEHMAVTSESVLGKRVRDLYFKERYDVIISRLNHAEAGLVASDDISLQFDNIFNLVGRPSAIDAVTSVLGNAQ